MATGRLFDGRSAQDRPVLLSFEQDNLAILDPVDGSLLQWPLAEIRRMDPDVPGPPITLGRKRDPSRLLVDDRSLIAALAGADRRFRSVSRWHGRHWSATVIALLLSLALIAVFIDRAPSLLAPLVPGALERRWSDATERAVSLGDDRCTGAAGLAALDRLVSTLSSAAGIPTPPHVSILDDTDVNAFTLPDGRIVVLRGLIKRASDPEELSGVLAHELGHTKNRDPTREALRRLELSMLAQALGWSGDLGSRLAALSYGRKAEARADASAVVTLRAAGLRADGLRRFLGSLKTGHETANLSFLSDHPSDGDRVAALPSDPAGRTALNGADWLAIKHVCDHP